MQEDAILVKLQPDGVATVVIERGAPCGSCISCKRTEDGKMLTEALNAAGAEVGDRVRINIDSSVVLRAVLIVYGVPLVGLIAGVLWGAHVAATYQLSETMQGVCGTGAGISLALLGLMAASWYTKHQQNSYRPTIVRRLDTTNA